MTDSLPSVSQMAADLAQAHVQANRSQLHQVTLINTDEGHTITFTCLGDELSDCHYYPECHCEWWDESHEHKSVEHAECWMVSWFDNNGQGVSYAGSDALEGCTCNQWDYCPPETRTGFITTAFADEYIEWEWINQPRLNAIKALTEGYEVAP